MYNITGSDKMNQTRIITLRAVLILLTVSLCAVIFALSADTADESNAKSDPVSEAFETSIFDNFSLSGNQTEFIKRYAVVIVRKAAHFSEYALLGFLISATCLSFNKTYGFTALISWICGTLYAVSDEIHQYFVPGRSCQLSDMLLDSAGVFAGVVFCIICVHICRKGRLKKISEQN